MKDDSLIERLRQVFVSWDIYKIEVGQIKAILFGAIGIIIVGFMSAVVTFFIKTR